MNSWLGKGSNGAGKLTWINSWQYKGSRSWGRWISADQQLTVKVAMKQVSAPGWTTDSGDSSCFTCHQLPLCFVLPRRSCLSKFFVTSRRKIRKCETVEDDSYFFYCHCVVSRPTDPPPCVDTLDNCAQYSDSACKAPYLEWAADNCRAFCGLCCELYCYCWSVPRRP